MSRIIRAQQALDRLYAALDTLTEKRCTLLLLENMADALADVTTAVGLARILLRQKAGHATPEEVADWLLSDPQVLEYVRQRLQE